MRIRRKLLWYHILVLSSLLPFANESLRYTPYPSRSMPSRFRLPSRRFLGVRYVWPQNSTERPSISKWPVADLYLFTHDPQPAQDEETPSSQPLSDSNELRHTQVPITRFLDKWNRHWLVPGTIGCREKSNGIKHKPQTTYTLKDCEFDGESMLSNGSARSTSELQFYRNPKSGQAFLVHGDMDIDTF